MLVSAPGRQLFGRAVVLRRRRRRARVLRGADRQRRTRGCLSPLHRLRERPHLPRRALRARVRPARHMSQRRRLQLVLRLQRLLRRVRRSVLLVLQRSELHRSRKRVQRRDDRLRVCVRILRLRRGVRVHRLRPVELRQLRPRVCSGSGLRRGHLQSVRPRGQRLLRLGHRVRDGASLRRHDVSA